MGFTSGTKTLGSSDTISGIIDEIAAGLIASAGGFWSDADAYNASSNPYGWRANGAWHLERTSGYALVNGSQYQITKRQTLDFTTAGAANNNIGTVFTAANSKTLSTGDAVFEVTPASQSNENSKRALKYENGAEVMYLTLEAINTSHTWGGSAFQGKGIRVGFSVGWDGINHVPTSTTYRSSILFESHSTTVIADLATLQITYYLWIDANGFVITGKPEPTADAYQQGFVLVVERNPNKEYSDGFSNFYAMAEISAHYATSLSYDATVYFRKFMRPFVFLVTSGDTNSHNQLPYLGIAYPAPANYTIGTLYAFKSIGNGKVYYIQPIISNSIDNLTPIFQSQLFFRYAEGSGLIDGDVVAVEGQTTKYLCKAIDSPDYATRLPIAMKYVA